jgi:small subunit ribosomal protein S18
MNLKSSSFQFPQISIPLVELEREEKQQTLTIRANYVPSPNAPYVVPQLKNNQECGSSKLCPECHLGLDIKHTDVLILSQYIRPDGCMMPRRVTGLCKRQQKRIGTMVTMAQKAGLMINLTPHYCKKDPKKRFGFRKFNKYYLESTIKEPRFC